MEFWALVLTFILPFSKYQKTINDGSSWPLILAQRIKDGEFFKKQV